MSEFYGKIALPAPDNIFVPEFIFNGKHEIRPDRPPNTPCLIDEETGRFIYFEELQAQTHHLARALKTHLLGDGDVVSIFTPNHVEFPVVLWAVQALGGIPSPTNPASTAEEYAYQLDILLPEFMFVHHSLLPVALEAARLVKNNLLSRHRVIVIGSHHGFPLELDTTRLTTVESLVALGQVEKPIAWKKFTAGEARTAPALLCWSSGTTGNPKAVEITHFNVMTQIITFQTHWQNLELPLEERPVRPGGVVSGVLPWYHIYGLAVGLQLPIFNGMTAMVTAKFNFEEMLKNISRYRISQLILVPPQVVLFCKNPIVKSYDLSSVRHMLTAAASLSPEIECQFAQVFPDVYQGQGYGMTETCAAAGLFMAGMDTSPGSAGRLVPGTVARVVKPDGTLARKGDAGELWLKGSQNAAGYWKNESGTKEVFVNGWVRTGDEVLFKENGEFFVTGRIKEIMKVKGFQVAPSELEGHLLNHPDVLDVAVVGTPDEYAGELPLAFVVLHDSTKAKLARNMVEHVALKAMLCKHVSDHKSNYKWLAGGVYFVDEIPRNPSGKILRRLLVEQAKQIKAEETMRAKL